MSLGLFDVNMPLIYGEGMKAFHRLQQTIISSSTDLSLFAWTQSAGQEPSWTGHQGGLLARSPDLFKPGLVTTQLAAGGNISLSNSGTSITVPLYALDPRIYIAVLLHQRYGPPTFWGILLARVADNLYQRVEYTGGDLLSLESGKDMAQYELDHLLTSPRRPIFVAHRGERVQISTTLTSIHVSLHDGGTTFFEVGQSPGRSYVASDECSVRPGKCNSGLLGAFSTSKEEIANGCPLTKFMVAVDGNMLITCILVFDKEAEVAFKAQELAHLDDYPGDLPYHLRPSIHHESLITRSPWGLWLDSGRRAHASTAMWEILSMDVSNTPFAPVKFQLLESTSGKLLVHARGVFSFRSSLAQFSPKVADVYSTVMLKVDADADHSGYIWLTIRTSFGDDPSHVAIRTAPSEAELRRNPNNFRAFSGPFVGTSEQYSDSRSGSENSAASSEHCR